MDVERGVCVRSWTQVPENGQLEGVAQGCHNYLLCDVWLAFQRAKSRRRFEPARLATIRAPLFMTTSTRAAS
jgi:hypothetical protein